MKFWRLVGLLLLVGISFGDAVPSISPDVSQRIERQVRSHYTVPPNVKILVGSLKPSEFTNYDALTITFDSGEKKQTFDFLLSKDNKTLVRVTKLDLSQDPYAEVMKKIDIKGRPVRGNKDAKVVVVNYDDFECPYCSRAHQTLFPELLKEYGDRIAFVYKDYPLAEIHPWAIHASVDANCLATQNNDAYWDFADYIHANQSVVNSEKGRDAQFAALDRITAEQGLKHGVDTAKLQACVKAQNDDAVKASIKEGDNAGVSATPTMFINGREVDGALPAGELRSMLDDALAQAGVPAPSHPGTASPGVTGASK
ncbi:MAG TPA: thioredoxin domain-containing protein [Terriglobales bacterium]|nr:thioredoxin domain-containing protein [Terriglobales bacterium]